MLKADVRRMKYLLLGLLVVFVLGCEGKKKQGSFKYFRNYQRTFNDMNDRHLKAAKQ